MAVDPTKTTPPANIEPGDVEETGVVEQKTRIQKVKEEHQKRANERANNQNELKVSYKKIMNEPAFKDILVTSPLLKMASVINKLAAKTTLAMQFNKLYSFHMKKELLNLTKPLALKNCHLILSAKSLRKH
jgi:hypothetical protein